MIAGVCIFSQLNKPLDSETSIQQYLATTNY
jgi:hypothetical protein